jgi:hypothetical protein
MESKAKWLMLVAAGLWLAKALANSTTAGQVVLWLLIVAAGVWIGRAIARWVRR